MALSNLDKDVSTRLFKMLSLNDDNQIEIIKIIILDMDN